MDARAIDIHTHIMPPAWDAFTERHAPLGFPSVPPHDGCSATIMLGERRFRDVDDRSFDPERRIRDMDANGIAMQLISPIPVMFCYWGDAEATAAFARLHNDFIAGVVARYPARFAGAGTIAMQSTPHAVREIERLAADGFAAIEIGTNFEGKEMDDPAIVEILEAAAAHDLAVFVHPATPAIGEARMRAYYLPFTIAYPAETSLAIARLIYGGVLDRIPALRIGFAHGGGSLTAVIGRLDRAFAVRPETRAHIDRPPSAYLDRLAFDTLTHDTDTLVSLVRRCGSGRVMLGSDYPFDMGVERALDQLDGVLLDEHALDDIRFRSARAFLGLHAAAR